MNRSFQDLMRDATRLTQAGQLGDATALIQQALGGGAARSGIVLENCIFEVSDTARAQSSQDLVDTARVPPEPPEGPEPPWARPSSASNDPEKLDVRRPGSGRFLEGSHTHASRTFRYKLYSPPGHFEGSRPLVVMLHGCTQDSDDFAAGTGMNALAAEQGFHVLYPEQANDANPSRCWNWFKHNHQARGRGETAAIATMTLAVVQSHAIDPERVYIAGLSAGGAMASLVAAAYPDVFAAVGVHSGLPPGAARSLPEGLAAMRTGAAGQQGATAMNGFPKSVNTASVKRVPPRVPVTLPLPAIVFHGDRDQTVHPRNGEQVVAAALRSGATNSARSPGSRPAVEHGVTPGGGRAYTRTIYRQDSGDAIAEHWLVHGAGHAWSGGRPAGSYTDAQGPDASREMLRFFFSRARQGARVSAETGSPAQD